MKKNTSRDNIVGIHAVRILLKIRPFDVYEIYISDKSIAGVPTLGSYTYSGENSKSDT